jgi:uncharacterized protein (TIGR03382 family)
MTDPTKPSVKVTARRVRRRHQVSAFMVMLATAALAIPVLGVPGASAAIPATGWIRFAHFASGRPPVAVTIDGKSIATDANFEDVTPYLSVAAGVHTIVVSTPGSSAAPLTGHSTVVPGGAITVAAVDSSVGIHLQTYNDDLSAAGPGQAKVRVIQTVASVPAVKVVLTAAPAVTTDAVRVGATSVAASAVNAASPASATAGVIDVPAVAFGSASAYLPVAAGTYQVVVQDSTGQTLIHGVNWPVLAGTVASIVVIQAAGGPTLEVIRDAAGASAVPMGGPATGYGGAAALLNPKPHSLSMVEDLGAGFALAGGAAIGLAVLRRRRKVATW